MTVGQLRQILSNDKIPDNMPVYISDMDYYNLDAKWVSIETNKDNQEYLYISSDTTTDSPDNIDDIWLGKSPFYDSGKSIDPDGKDCWWYHRNKIDPPYKKEL